MKRISTVLTALMISLCLFVFSGTALAYDAIPDLDAHCSLAVKTPQNGISYKVYRVCSVDAYARFTPTEEFESMPRIRELIARSAWYELTSSVAAWITNAEADGSTLLPCAAGHTCDYGDYYSANFEALSVGLYYVHGVGTGSWQPVDFVVCLPNWVDDQWVNNVVVENKGISIPEYTNLHVLKRWRGNGYQAVPASVSVDLIRTSRETGFAEVWDTVELDSKSGWDHTWVDLDNSTYSWSVREVPVPGGYSVEYSQIGSNFVVTNVMNPRGPDPESPVEENLPDPPKALPKSPNDPPYVPPEGPPDIPSEDIFDPDIPLSSIPFEEEDDLFEIDDDSVPLSSLPQTGMLWWPVPVLAVSGMCMYLAGFFLCRRRTHDEE